MQAITSKTRVDKIQNYPFAFIYFKHQQFVFSSNPTTFKKRKKDKYLYTKEFLNRQFECISTLNKLVETKINIKYPVKPSSVPEACSRRCKFPGIVVGLQEKTQKKCTILFEIFTSKNIKAS